MTAKQGHTLEATALVIMLVCMASTMTQHKVSAARRRNYYRHCEVRRRGSAYARH